MGLLKHSFAVLINIYTNFVWSARYVSMNTVCGVIKFALVTEKQENCCAIDFERQRQFWFS